MDQAYKILAFEDNGSLPHRLVVAMPKKKGIDNRLETQ